MNTSVDSVNALRDKDEESGNSPSGNSSSDSTKPGSASNTKSGQYRIGEGLLDHSKSVEFTFNDRKMRGSHGDTLASALLANGQRLVGRSFKYHRPRGIFSAGVEEPNALMEIGQGAKQDPNTRATVTELYDGLIARSQNHRGSLEFDLMAINDLAAPLLAAGFYYKTFMWPASFWEKVYEPAIRSAAGLGRLSMEADPAEYDKGFRFADLLIVGAGPTGLAAALAAGKSGARVIICEEDFLPGGRLNAETHLVDGMSGASWAAQTVITLNAMPNVTLMTRTSVIGAYDHGVYGALERVTDHVGEIDGCARQILWRIRAKRTLLGAGSIERPIAFPDNDRPGIMLAGAVRTYLNRFGVTAGHRTAILTNNDDGWRTALDLAHAGSEVVAVIDTRDVNPPVDVTSLQGAMLFRAEHVVGSGGRKALSYITLSNGKKVFTDCLAMAGGWNPTVHLSCHQRGRPVWNEAISSFVPGGELPVGMKVAGAANGTLSLQACLQDGHQQALDLLCSINNDSSNRLGKPAQSQSIAFDIAQAEKAPQAIDEPSQLEAFWHAPSPSRGILSAWSRSWVDMQNDVTTKDIALSHQEGFEASEHVKRYTTLGMATDQGKTGNILGLAVLADSTGRSIADTGTTIYRPPWTPVAIAAFAGPARGADFRATRYTPSHQWASEQGAVFVEVGAWMRAQWFPREGETHWRQSVDREVLQTRSAVGVCDVTTLGKIDVQGRDAGAFLDRIYCNTFSTLAVGKVRYGLMLREDGFVMDDGTTARLGEHHYVMTTTTANAVSVFRHMEFARQCLWPELDVHLISSTESWAQYAIAGPHSRELVTKLVDNVDMSNEAFPFMACAEITICNGIPARLFRISFSGELAYELAVPTRYGDALMRRLMAEGEPLGVVAYGTEALGVMRIEKGHAAGNELNGQTTAMDLGLGRMVSRKKDCIGNVLSQRPGLIDVHRPRLVGFKPVDQSQSVRAGAHFISKGKSVVTENDEGWMTSVAFSPNLEHSIGLGYIKDGANRMGEQVRACDPLRGEEIVVEICSPHFIDPEGVRLRG